MLDPLLLDYTEQLDATRKIVRVNPYSMSRTIRNVHAATWSEGLSAMSILILGRKGTSGGGTASCEDPGEGLQEESELVKDSGMVRKKVLNDAGGIVRGIGI